MIRQRKSHKGMKCVEFQSVLRLRPLLKKEREDPIVVGRLLSDPATAVLHPMPQKPNEILSPSSELVRQTLSPELVQIGHDLEFSLDQIWPDDADQDKIYFSLGLPMALSAMEPLKVDPHATRVERKNHLVIGMGVAGSGKTYTCWGGQTIHPKRKNDSDGLVPRIVESLFSQSKHHLFRNKRDCTFSVNFSVHQVNQNKNKSGDCKIHDLLQPVVARSFSISSTTSSFSRTSSNNSSSKYPSIIENIMSVEQHSKQSMKSCGSAQYSSLDEPVFIEQDSVSADFRLVNGQVRTCRSSEEAREVLQTAMKNAARLSNKRNQSHLLVTMQPVLVDRSGRTHRQGGSIAVLEMAAYDPMAAGGPISRSAGRGKESVPVQNGAHAAILHCLRTHQANEAIRKGLQHNQQPLCDNDENGNTSVDEESRDNKPALPRRQSLKKVPYRQHTLSMMLQPLFTANDTDKILVTLFLTAYPGHRDYAEKKSLLNDVSCFRGGPPSKPVATGLELHPASASRASRKKDRPIRERKKMCPVPADSDADDEGSDVQVKVFKAMMKKKTPPMQVPTDIVNPNPIAVAPGICNVASMTYSDEADDDCHFVEPLPPPVAPGYLVNSRCSKTSSNVRGSVLSPEASAPLEFTPAVLPCFHKRNNTLTDFPGVDMLSPASIKSIMTDESGPPPPPMPLYHSNHPGNRHEGVAATASCALKAREELSPTPFDPSNCIFSPLQTFNKVVNASKKKGQQVIVKMGQQLTVDKEVDHDMQQKVESLEIENIRITKENDSLKCKNEQLEREVEQLRSRLCKQEEDQDYNNNNNDYDSPASREGDWDSYRRERSAKASLVDSSLLAHMASMGGGY